MFAVEDKLRLYVPEACREQIIREYDDSSIAGHFGWKKVFHAVSQWYYWDTMQGDVTAYVKACPHCQLYNPTVQPTPVILPSTPISRPFAEISLDWASNLPQTRTQFNSLLNVIDRFSKWATVTPCDKTMTTSQLVEHLWKHVLSWAGLPAKINGDRDTRLRSSTMRHFLKVLNVKLALSASYRPQTDGSTERVNCTFLTMLRTCCRNSRRTWDLEVPALLYAYHNTVHSATGYTPHHLLFGWNSIDLPSTFQTASEHPDIDSFFSARASMFSKARGALEHTRQAMINNRNASANAHVYEVGQIVKISTRVLRPSQAAEPVRKMAPLYLGPFEVTALLGQRLFQLIILQNNKVLSTSRMCALGLIMLLILSNLIILLLSRMIQSIEY
jgi:hypothetical protein